MIFNHRHYSQFKDLFSYYLSEQITHHKGDVFCAFDEQSGAGFLLFIPSDPTAKFCQIFEASLQANYLAYEQLSRQFPASDTKIFEQNFVNYMSNLSPKKVA